MRTEGTYQELAQNQRGTGSSQVPHRSIQLKLGLHKKAACPLSTHGSWHGYPTDTVFHRQNEGPNHPFNMSTPQCRWYQMAVAMDILAGRALVLHCGSGRGMGEGMCIMVILVYWMANHTLTYSFLRQESRLVLGMGSWEAYWWRHEPAVCWWQSHLSWIPICCRAMRQCFGWWSKPDTRCKGVCDPKGPHVQTNGRGSGGVGGGHTQPAHKDNKWHVLRQWWRVKEGIPCFIGRSST